MRYVREKIKEKVTLGTVETLFWIAAISISIFVNISPKIVGQSNTFFIIALLFAFLVLILGSLTGKKEITGKMKLFAAGIAAIAAFTVFLVWMGAFNLVMVYYLPGIIALSMAFMVIVEPKSPVIVLVALCTFFLGEGFWSISVTEQQRLQFPTTFMRVFSLTLVAMFAYHLYRREISLRGKLVLANEQLESYSRLKSDFVATVSHELRTPLTSIKNAVVLLKKKTSGENVAISDGELKDIIVSTIDRQAHLIAELFDLANIEQGRLGSPRSRVNAGRIAHDVVKSLKIHASEKNIELTADIPQDLPEIYASGNQLAEVYTNIIDNAIKYTDDHGKVALKIYVEEKNLKSVIEDNGMGIPQNDLTRLFDKFIRLEEMLHKKRKGIGLGLAITKEIVEQHGGKIWVESRLGIGSRFIFTLPLGLRRVDKRE
ncbi:MAG: HAMP domain-containing sensor histidine kinase [Candidatus Omnitrophota bacterium]